MRWRFEADCACTGETHAAAASPAMNSRRRMRSPRRAPGWITGYRDPVWKGTGHGRAGVVCAGSNRTPAKSSILSDPAGAATLASVEGFTQRSIPCRTAGQWALPRSACHSGLDCVVKLRGHWPPKTLSMLAVTKAFHQSATSEYNHRYIAGFSGSFSIASRQAPVVHQLKEGAMDEKENGTYRRLIDIGLNDPSSA